MSRGAISSATAGSSDRFVSKVDTRRGAATLALGTSMPAVPSVTVAAAVVSAPTMMAIMRPIGRIAAEGVGLTPGWPFAVDPVERQLGRKHPEDGEHRKDFDDAESVHAFAGPHTFPPATAGLRLGGESRRKVEMLLYCMEISALSFFLPPIKSPAPSRSRSFCSRGDLCRPAESRGSREKRPTPGWAAPH
jgi:hypothetical protein